MSKWAGLFLVITIPVALCSYQLGKGSRHSTTLPAPHQHPENSTTEAITNTLDDSYVGFMPEAVELGDQPWRAEVPFTVSFVNGSDDPLEIAVVKRSCGCTSLNTAEYAGRIVGPNELVDFSGAIHVGERVGRRSESISVMLTSGAVHMVNIETSVFATYDWTPREVDFGEVELEGDADAPSSIVHFFSDTARIVGQADPDVPWLVASVVEAEHGSWRIAVGVQKDRLLYDENYGRVRIATDDPTRPVFMIPVRAVGISELRPVPAHLFLTAGQSGTVACLTRDGRRARLASVLPRDNSLSSRIVLDGDGHIIEIHPLDGVELPHTSCLDLLDEQGHSTTLWVTVLAR